MIQLTALERAALRIWRERNNVDTELFKIDTTCTCSWCKARRAFVSACKEHYEKRREEK